MTVNKPSITTDNQPTFTQTEVPPQFPGGLMEWRKFLEKNLNASIGDKFNAPKGTHTVIAQFIVEKDGSISDLKALTKHGYGLEEEVIRILSNGPRWIPAIQNGEQVRAYRKQPITFVIAE
jgi:protein TonB